MASRGPPVYNFPDSHIQVDGKSLNYVKPFTYLACKVDLSASLDDEIVNCLAKAFGKLRHCLWNERGIKLDTKELVHKAAMLITLLYGSEFV